MVCSLLCWVSPDEAEFTAHRPCAACGASSAGRPSPSPTLTARASSWRRRLTDARMNKKATRRRSMSNLLVKLLFALSLSQLYY